jgi:hypothetical protein
MERNQHEKVLLERLETLLSLFNRFLELQEQKMILIDKETELEQELLELPDLTETERVQELLFIQRIYQASGYRTLYDEENLRIHIFAKNLEKRAHIQFNVVYYVDIGQGVRKYKTAQGLINYLKKHDIHMSFSGI